MEISEVVQSRLDTLRLFLIQLRVSIQVLLSLPIPDDAKQALQQLDQAFLRYMETTRKYNG